MAAQGDFWAVDATAKRFEALWRVPDVTGRPIAVARSASEVRFVVRGAQYEEWTYSFPLLRLKSRQQGTADSPAAPAAALTPDGWLVLALGASGADGGPADGVELWLERVGHSSSSHGRAAAGRAGPIAAYGPEPRVASAVYDEGGAHVRLASGRELAPACGVTLAGAKRVALRLDERFLSVADDRGRVLVVEIETGELVTDLRL